MSWRHQVKGGPLVASVATGIATLSVLSVTLSVALRARTAATGLELPPLDVPTLVVAVLFPPVGALVLSRRPANAAGWVLLSTALLGAQHLAGEYAVRGSLVRPGSLPLVDVAAWVQHWAYAPILLVPTLLPLLFPDGRLPSPRWRWLLRAVVAAFIATVVSRWFAPGVLDVSPDLRNPLGIESAGWLNGVTAVGSGLLGAVAGPLCVFALLRRLRSAEGRERAQLAWLAIGMLIAVATGLAAAFLPRPVAQALWSVGLAAVPLTVVVAVLRHRLFDVESTLDRVVAYGFLGGTVALAHVATLVLAGGLAARQGLAAAAAATAAVVATAVRGSVLRRVERLLFGARRDPLAVLDATARALDVGDPSGSAQRVAEAVRGALKLPGVAVLPVAPSRISALAGELPARTREVPVLVAGERVATLLAGHRSLGQGLSRQECAALDEVGRQLGALLLAAELTAEARRSQRLLVAAREEERRRVRNDLHDGIGPVLAGSALQLDALATELRDQPDVAERLQGLRERVRHTVVEVRRVIEGLRPAALDEAGLADALRRQALHLGAPVAAGATTTPAARGPYVVVRAEPLGDLPAAVEVAAYRIAVEAMHNAVRHSGGQRCEVLLSQAGGELLLTVSDDGRGIRAGAAPGVGTTSMRDRAREVGGSLHTQSGESGTTVHVRLPVDAP